jgi:VanZ family protein
MAVHDSAHPARRISALVLSIYWVALFVATHVPMLQPPPQIPNSDKWSHFLAFGLLAALFAWTWSLRGAFGWRQALAVLAILVVYGALDEATQPYVGRHGNMPDWYADVTGIVFGLAAFVAARRFFWARA